MSNKTLREEIEEHIRKVCSCDGEEECIVSILNFEKQALQQVREEAYIEAQKDLIKDYKKDLQQVREKTLTEIEEKIINMPLKTGDGLENDEEAPDTIDIAFLRQEQREALRKMKQ